MPHIIREQIFLFAWQAADSGRASRAALRVHWMFPWWSWRARALAPSTPGSSYGLSSRSFPLGFCPFLYRVEVCRSALESRRSRLGECGSLPASDQAHSPFTDHSTMGNNLCSKMEIHTRPPRRALWQLNGLIKNCTCHVSDSVKW